MASATSINEELEKLLECNICLERLNNPKVLNCTHSFCKTCLDNLLDFHLDGRAVICCPLRCGESTVINVDKTTNDLKAPLQLKNIIELLVEKHDGHDSTNMQLIRCQGYMECKNKVSFSCLSCFEKFCSSCKSNHKHREKQNTEDIKFLRIKNKKDDPYILPWCEMHSTYATYVCEEGFICLYCKARAHSTHFYDRIDRLSQRIERWVKKKKPRLPDVHNLIASSKQKTEEEAKRIKKVLMSEIRRRKATVIQDYMIKLQKEEEKLLSEFDAAIIQHLKSYPLSSPMEYINDKPNFQLCASKDFIFKNVNNVSSSKVKIPYKSFSFSVESMSEANPLGVLEENTGSTELSDNLASVTSSIGQDNLTLACLYRLIDDLQLIQRELEGKHVERKMKESLVKDEKEDNEEEYVGMLNALRNSNKSDKEKMVLLCNMIEDNDITGFRFAWNAVPNYLMQLNYQGYNMLQLAATFDKPNFIKVILDTGCDVNEYSYGEPALFLAAANRNFLTVQLLVEHKANIRNRDHGFNAIDIAKMVYAPDIVEYLLKELKMRNLKDNGALSDKNIRKENVGRLSAQYILEEIPKDDFDFPLDSDADSDDGKDSEGDYSVKSISENQLKFTVDAGNDSDIDFVVELSSR